MKDTKVRRIICAALIILTLIFIWGNSLLPAEYSRLVSRAAKNFLRFLAGKPPITGGGKGSGLLRKIAHFTEFALLGMELCWLCRMKKKNVFLPLAMGIPVAWIDEGIQYFIPGRSCQLWDVCLDSLGLTTGFILILLLSFILERRKRPK